MAFINLLDILYPIDSVYISFNDISPSKLIGGSWTKLENRVIRAGNDINTGGSDNSSHTHDLSSGYAMGEVIWNQGQGKYDSAWKIVATPSYGFNTYAAIPSSYSSYTGNTTRGIQLGGKTNSQTIDNLPAYQNLYIWRRIN